MLYHGSQAGAFDLKTVVLESITSMRRAGVFNIWLKQLIARKKWCVEQPNIIVALQVQTSSSHTILQVFWTG